MSCLVLQDKQNFLDSTMVDTSAVEMLVSAREYDTKSIPWRSLAILSGSEYF
ncbi:hypothetical protein [Calothrix sp. 336/3]|uniref:hypothetical protein n=1 Tax=Calothrix sp. 336/3 TaxID=1337936 RepID=UPI0014395BD8|nr:hypothetical protein [Calothrix sp. 336/3]